MRWAGPATWAGSVGDFDPAFIWNFLSHCKKLVARHGKKIVLITWLLSMKFYIFNIDFRRLQQFSFYCIQYYEYDHCFFYYFATSLDFTYISFTFIRFYLSGSTRRSHFWNRVWNKFQKYSCALKKNLSHFAGLAHLHIFKWQIFISPGWDPGKIKWDPT